MSLVSYVLRYIKDIETHKRGHDSMTTGPSQTIILLTSSRKKQQQERDREGRGVECEGDNITGGK